MRPTLLRSLLLLGVFTLAVSCAGDGPTAPARVELRRPATAGVVGTGPAVRIAEIHYDNTGTDAGEAIEISGPAGTDLTGWTVVLYNGNVPSAAVAYGTTALTGTIPTTCNQRGVVVVSYPVNGIQNGPNDGVALVNNVGTVVEFLSYEGPMTASAGPALGLTSTNIGVSEVGTEVVGLSLQRRPDGTWTSPVPQTFGACNDGDENAGATPTVASVVVSPEAATVQVGATVALTASARDAADAPIAGAALSWTSTAEAVATVSASGLVTGVAAGDALIIAAAENGRADTATVTVTPPPPPPAGVRFSELHYDNFGTDVNEGIEVEGPAGTDLAGWRIYLYNGNGGVTYEPTQTLSGTIPDACSGRGVVAVTYPSNGIQNGAPDGMALVNADGTVIEFLSYEGTFTATNGPAAGLTSVDIGVLQNSAPVGTSLQRNAAGTWVEAPSNLGYCFGVTPPPPANGITFSGRDNTDPPLPVGFEDQLFATLRSGADGSTIATTWTWTSETPLLASVDANGVVRALGAGTMVLRATASDGTTATYALESRVASPGTAAYANNTEFGDPSDGDASDEIILRRAQYTSSFSAARGIPNWVSYDLDASHFGAEDRCDCFTYDPELPAAQRYTTADYTGAGAAAGYGIDRGHLARSFDRTSGSADNATTFYFANIIPQASDNNQGPWAAFETYLGDLARFSDREVHIIAGASGSKGTVKNEGRITIPTITWKVAVVLPRDGGLSAVHGPDDLEVIAVLMPNDPGIRNVPWETYRVTVDAVEAASGFDVLSALRDDIEIAVESGTRAPTAALDGPWSTIAGDLLTMSGAGSTDPDADALAFAWDFGDGTTGTGATPSHAFGAAGAFTVTLVVTDARGLADTTVSTATVAPFTTALGFARWRSTTTALYADGALSKAMRNTLLGVLDKAEAAAAAGDAAKARQRVEEAIEDIAVALRKNLISRASADAVLAILDRTLATL
ncbi:MAG: DNA/RNA non-specific endonuclease [Gemmatimonadaceae bacterium]|nr:DNA/RNA non-specific endonuclease [Gemmatimonadaceae bacterium]